MTSPFLLGVNLAGAEFGNGDAQNGHEDPKTVPGVYGKDYTYPTHAEIDYYSSKGLEIIRLPFLWERLQQSKLGPLDPAELGRLDDVVNYAASKGLKIEIEPHNWVRFQRAGRKFGYPEFGLCRSVEQARVPL